MALKEVGEEVVDILQDSDLEMLYNKTKLSSVYKKTRWCVLLFLFRAGLLPESFERVLVESVAIHKKKGFV